MKIKILFFIATFAFYGLTANAQRGLKIGYVDMEYILANVPEYQAASAQLDAKVQQWKAEIELKRKAIEALEEELENERPLLTEELIEERLADIKWEEAQLLEYQQQRFGPNGDLIVQKRQLVQPVQDQIFNAVQEIGKVREYDFIYNNSSKALMLYSADRHDISDQILNMIKRSSRQAQREVAKETKEEETKPVYKSVTQAKEDKEEAAERQATQDKRERERQAKINARQAERDSLQAAREAKYEARRAALLEERADRKRERDSLNKLREERRNSQQEE